MAGAVAALSFAPLRLPLLMLAAMLVWMLFTARAATWKQGFAVGIAFGLGFFLVGVSWVYVSMHVYGQMPMPLAALATFLFAAYLALFPAAASAGAVWLRNRRRLGQAPTFLLLLPAVWVAFEWLRAWLFTGFPWLTIGYSQAPDGWLAGFAPVLGAFGISGVIVLQAGLLCLAWTWRESARRGALYCVAAFALVVMAGWGLGRVEWSEPEGKPLKTALLQGNVPQDRKWLAEVRTATLIQYREMILQSDARMIVLPETALPLFFDQIPGDYLAELGAHAGRMNGRILLGTVERTAVDGAYDYFNAVAAIGGAETARYRKSHLVPFGEFIPTGFGWVLNILKIPLTDFARGGSAQLPFGVADQRVAANICYEDGFGSEIIHALPHATMLVNVSNVAWFGRSWAADQHFQMSQMRAMETARWMLRATNTGVTGAIDERGRAVAVLPQHTAGVLTVEAQGRRGITPFVRWGDWPVMILCLLVLAGISFRPRR